MADMTVRRLNVDVYAHFSCDGKIIPKSMSLYKTEESYAITKVLDIQPAANLKVGGRGLRYRVLMLHTTPDGATIEVPRTLWLERYTWFVEEAVATPVEEAG